MSNQPSAEARQDYDALLQALMPFAEEMLKKHGEFFPFGAAVNAAGEVAAHGADTGSESPEPQEVIDLLVRGFQAEAREGKIRAAGICTNGRISNEGKPTDAVIIRLEHNSGNAMKTCVPYKKGLFGGYKFGQLVAGLDEARIFAASA